VYFYVEWNFYPSYTPLFLLKKVGCKIFVKKVEGGRMVFYKG